MSKGIRKTLVMGFLRKNDKPACMPTWWLRAFLGLPGCIADKFQCPRLGQQILGPPGLSHA